MKRILTILLLSFCAFTSLWAQTPYSPSKAALEGALGLVTTVNVRGTVYDNQANAKFPNALTPSGITNSLVFNRSAEVP